MKTKLRLGVRVPNEGARRLAQWIMREPVGTLDKLLRKIGMGQIDMERMMAGELTPGADIGHQIFAFTRCGVTINDWYRPATDGWFAVVPVETPWRAA
jgi:hypothetical protein